jgi:hypothetical protein
MAHEKAPKQTNPGAGAYNPHGVSAVEERYKASKSKVQGFGARAERKGWARNMQTPYNTPFYQTTPGPGTYGEKRTAFGKQARKMLIEEPIGFGATNSRPCMDKKKGVGEVVNKTPGPGSYLTGSSYGTITSGIQSKAGVGRNGIFGSTSHRFSHGIFEDQPDGMQDPGPGTFEMNPPDSFGASHMNPLPAPNTDVQARRVQQGVFKSKSNRFGSNRPQPDHASLGIEAQEPGVYEINLPSSFDPKVASGVNTDKPQPFASTASRFNSKQYMGQVKETTPGPGAYGKSSAEASGFVVKPAMRRPLAPPGTISMDARFKSGAGSFANTKNTPGGLGPGSYDTGGSMAKKSYNITMVHKS